MDVRLPAHLEVSAMMRHVRDAGGFATVIHKGERDAGSILVILADRGEDSRLYERMPSLEGGRTWRCVRELDAHSAEDFSAYLSRRAEQDPDSWIIELDIADGERFIVNFK